MNPSPPVVPNSSGSASEWELDNDCIYLNHGSFGPSPKPVRDARSRWSERIERQPMRFFCREMEEELENASEVLAGFLKTRADRIALLENATVAMNVVSASIGLTNTDEVILTDHEYGAVRNIWQARCRESGSRLITVALPFPPHDDAVVEQIAAAVTSHTRLIVVSHVTSATACVLPVQKICRMAAEKGVPVCVDGPHAVAMLDLNLDAMGCDFYCASCHKWLCAPFGSGFLWVHPRWHSAIRPPIVSWGGSIAGRRPSWKDQTNWSGTRDPAALLSIPDAVRFFHHDRLQEFRSHAHTLVSFARRELLKLPGVNSFCTPEESDFVSMAAVELPVTHGWKPGYHGHPDDLQIQLRDRYQIETLTGCWRERRWLRISAHLYSTLNHMETLVHAVREILNQDQ